MKSIVATAFICMAIAMPVRATESIVSEGVVAAPTAAVWNAWSTASGLRAWLAPHADVDLRIDGLMRANYDPQASLGGPGTIENRILSYEPGRMLSIRVARAPENFPFKARVAEMWTVLHFEPTADGNTLLRIVGMGFGADKESQKMKEFFRRGNAYTLAQLQQHFRP